MSDLEFLSSTIPFSHHYSLSTFTFFIRLPVLDTTKNVPVDAQNKRRSSGGLKKKPAAYNKYMSEELARLKSNTPSAHEFSSFLLSSSASHSQAFVNALIALICFMGGQAIAPLVSTPSTLLRILLSFISSSHSAPGLPEAPDRDSPTASLSTMFDLDSDGQFEFDPYSAGSSSLALLSAMQQMAETDPPPMALVASPTDDPEAQTSTWKGKGVSMPMPIPPAL
ncbi:hypothetical protein B0H17DRAFT_1214479 [Mycena rosella]|uniref:Uncharacterized protein n=1 Tax=Mycena rosella TaxID=1033263 RepID=A0AAD7CMY6_MYCRO|nr:hypothetical protein B0H17DRAFT_1214479 [Mycena rosella]